MRFGYVLLGLVTLMPLHNSSGQCSNGLAGIQKYNICCDADCGTCGGNNCGELPGGRESCCTARISDNGLLCSETQAAPCIIDPSCKNGLPGVQSGVDSICCETQCGRCGGPGCGQRPGGESACCKTAIMESGVMCSTSSAAPCIVDNPMDEGPCINGVAGVDKDGTCCEAQCGACGGVNCGDRPGGKDACCTNRIQGSGVYCDDTPVAPCIMFDDPTDDC